MNQSDITPGMKVRVTQRIDRREGPWDSQTVGTVISAEPKPSGSSYAHGKDGKFWILRLELQKDDGEITTLALDRNTQITKL